MKKRRTINGIKLAYEERGEGDGVLLLLHGNGESSEIFGKLYGRLNFCGRIFALDARGHGESEFAEPFGIRQFASDAAEFLRSERLSEVIVIGYSDGANVAAYLALECPELLKECVLISGNVFRKGLKSSFLLSCSVVNALLAPFSFLPSVKRRRALLRLMLTDIGIGEEDLRKITVPCQVVCAERDVVKPSHTRFLAECLGVREKTVSGATHFDILEKIDFDIS